MTDASTQRWEAHIRMSESSGHVISARDQSHLPSVENSHSHSPNADRQLHKHALFLQTAWTSGISTARRHFILCIHHWTASTTLPTSQPKFRPDASSFFPTKGEMHLSTYLNAKQNLQLSEATGSASPTVLSHDRIILVLAPDGSLVHLSVLHNVISWTTPGSTSPSFLPSSPDTTQI